MTNFFAAVRDYLNDPFFDNRFRAKLAHLPAAVLYALKPSTRALYRITKE